MSADHSIILEVVIRNSMAAVDASTGLVTSWDSRTRWEYQHNILQMTLIYIQEDSIM